MASRASGIGNPTAGPVAGSGSLLKAGYLTKEGKSVKSWKKRYWRLYNDKLIYSKDDKEDQSIGTIHIQDVIGVSQSAHRGRKLCFYVQTSSRIYYMQAETQKEMDEWRDALVYAVVTQIGIRFSFTQVTRLREVFDKYDLHDTGVLDYDMLRTALKALGKVVRGDYLDTAVAAFDRTGNGLVDLLEFACGMWMLFKGYKAFETSTPVDANKRIDVLEKELEKLKVENTLLREQGGSSSGC